MINQILEKAFKEKNLKRVKTLLEKNESWALATDRMGRNTLHLAVTYNFSEVVPLLKEKNVDMNGLDTEDRTALHIAAGKGDGKMVNALISAGVSLEGKDTQDRSPLETAQRYGCRTAESAISKAKSDERQADLDDGVWRDINKAGELCDSIFAPGAGDPGLSTTEEKPAASKKWVKAVTDPAQKKEPDQSTKLTLLSSRTPKPHPRIPQANTWGACKQG